jgi:hypothetical protein
MPQITAISECYQAAREHNIPVIADSGIKYSGDVVKAIAASANVGHDRFIVRGGRREPGRNDPPPGPQLQDLPLNCGMGSLSGCRASFERYFQGNIVCLKSEAARIITLKANAGVLPSSKILLLFFAEIRFRLARNCPGSVQAIALGDYKAAGRLRAFRVPSLRRSSRSAVGSS